MQGVIEGILFVVGSEGITKEKLLEITELNENDLNELIDQLNEEYNKDSHGIHLEILGNKIRLITKKEHNKYYERLLENEKQGELTQAALETLAVIAYNSPTTRGNIDEIRGVDSSYQIRKLIYRNLIKEVGRADLPGRPILYGVTDEFLNYLGLSSLEDLPKLEEIPFDNDEIADLYKSKYKEK